MSATTTINAESAENAEIVFGRDLSRWPGLRLLVASALPAVSVLFVSSVKSVSAVSAFSALIALA